MSPLRRALALVVPAAALASTVLSAQGVTTAGIKGVVTGADSAGIPNASVTVTNAATGERWETITGTRGRYALEYLSVGGPYSIEARAIGFTPTGTGGITLSLGERHRVDLVLSSAVAQLAEVTVTAEQDERLNSGRTGPAQSISGAMISNLPLPSQDFSRLVLLSPQAALTRDGGITIAGQSDRLNGFQIDGTSNADLGGISGLSGFGTPGAASGVRTLSVEALQELQILIAPFDVRYGNFAGGLVNAVTRSGSNRWEGSVTTYVQDESLTGLDSAGKRAVDFSTRELTVTLAGPIVHDHAAFFLDAGLQRFVGARDPSIGTDTTGGADSAGIGIRLADAVRFQDILRSTYHVDPGAIEPPPARIPGGNLFAKVSLWPALNQRIEVSHNYAHGSFQRLGFTVGDGGYPLSSMAFEKPATVNATRVAWTMSGASGLSNELTVSRFRERESCLGAVPYPEIIASVSPDPEDPRSLGAGTTNSCAARFASQTIWELTDNASWSMGAHHLTLGTHDELIHLDGVRRPGVAAGRWFFDGLDSLEQGVARRYVRDVSGSSTAGRAVNAFDVHQLGLYLQDQWTPASGLTLTGGLRFDVPYLPTTPVQNPALESGRLGVTTAVTPSGNLLWSPRLGFNYDAGSRGRTFVRGGVGLFSGRPIYLYFSNIFETNGVNLFRIDCKDAGDVPAFTIDPALQPVRCLSSPQMGFEVNYFNPTFRFPRNLRLSLGTDVALPEGVVGTVDLLYIRALNQLAITDVNLLPPGATSAGEDDRPLYGSFDADGTPTPNRLDTAYASVAEMGNSSGDRAFSGTVQLQKRLRSGAEVTLAYTYTDARDRVSANCFRIDCNLDFEALDGTLNDRRLSASSLESRHKITLGAIANLPLRFRLGLFYNGYSGHPYTYTVSGDVNADGLDVNDAVYLPKNAGDITLADPGQWASFDTLIRSQPCLDAQRGHVMRRNSCRGGWATILNAQVSRLFALGRGQSLELTADLFNALNFINRGWGVQRTFLLEPQTQPSILELVGYDQANQRGMYNFYPPDRKARDEEATRWRMQLGARYAF
jgi:outer membrane receptor protein involved in Fe transport